MPKKKRKTSFDSDMFKKLLKNSGKKMGFIADTLKVSRMTISSWKTGRHDPSLVHMNKLARIFAVDLTTMIKK